MLSHGSAHCAENIGERFKSPSDTNRSPVAPRPWSPARFDGRPVHTRLPGAAAARANARGRVRVRLLPRHGRVRADSGRGAPVRRAAAQLPAWDRRRQHAAPRHRTPCACPKRPRPTPAGSRSRADPGLAASRNSACPARVDPEGEGAAGRRCSQHGLPHETFRVSSQRCRAARRTRRVRSTARSRAGRAHRQAGAFLS
jgi:hypothetical protein